MGMELHDIRHFTKGWFVGAFEPTIIKTQDVEVAIKYYKAGDYEARHHHRVATEITGIISGRVRMNGQEIGPGQLVSLVPGISSDFEVLEDTVTVVVKHPSASDDKYPGEMPTSA